MPANTLKMSWLTLPRLPAWPDFKHSLLLRIGGAIAAISLLAVLGMAVSWLVAESTQGSGEAINRAGSLRMQGWRMTALSLTHGGSTTRRAELAQAILSFDATIADPAIQALLRQAGAAELNHAWQQVHREWRERIRPRFVAHAEDDGSIQDAQMVADMGRFVAVINLLVKRMEESTEAKIMVMRVVLGVAILLTVVVVALTVWLLHAHLVQPLRALLNLAAHVGRGELTTRTRFTGEDELGKLGRAFNLMTEDLSRLYGNLEARVTQKTAELTRSNQSLELLYHSISRLHGAPPGRETYLAVLRDIESLLDLGHGIICLGELGGKTGTAVASTLLPEEASPCHGGQCAWCHGTSQTRFSMDNGFKQHLTLPLADAEQQYGVLILEIPAGRHLEAWQVQLLEALSRHIGVAIGAERRIEQGRRLALLEERAVIARELHDSLAQSLAYMRIQVGRMRKVVHDSREGNGGIERLSPVLDELREGLNAAYVQLRELLSSFRLKMENAPLSKLLADAVVEFSARGDLAIDIDLDMERCPLSPNQEIHVLHIIREALSNIVHHAQARQAWIRIGCAGDGEVEVTVADDGQGIVKADSRRQHYGMTIMEERARTLNGTLSFEPRPSGGTRVSLRFPAQGASR